MNSVPGTFFQRELGWNSGRRPLLDYKKYLSGLEWKDEDRISLMKQMTNSSQFDTVSRPPANPVYSMEFCPINQAPNILAVTDEVGAVTLIDTQEGAKYKIRAYHRCHQNALYKVTWSPHRPNVIATASSDQMVNIWDVNNFQALATYTGHTRTVKTVKFHPTHPGILASAGRDGAIMIWDLRVSSTSEPENIICNAHSFMFKSKWLKIPKQHKRLTEISLPVTDLILKDDHTLISCGATDGFIKFWDLRKTYKHLTRVDPVSAYRFPSEEMNYIGYSAMCLDGMNNLYISTATIDIFKYNLSSDNDLPEQCFRRGFKSDYSMNLDLSTDGRYLISGSGGVYGYIWDTWDKSGAPHLRLESTDEQGIVCCGLFSPDDPLKVVTGGDDSHVTIWRVDPLRGIKKSEDGAPTPAHSSVAILRSSVASKSKHVSKKSPKPMQEERLRSLLPKYQKILPKPDLEMKTSFNLSVLLNDLPNYVVNGIQPHIANKQEKCFTSTPERKDIASWLRSETPGRGEKRSKLSSSFSASAFDSKPKRIKIKSAIPLPLTTPPTVKRSPRVSSVKANSSSKARSAPRKGTKRLSMGSPAEQSANGSGSPQVASPSTILKYFAPILIPDPGAVAQVTPPQQSE